jgi:hypothetical protein
MVPHPLVRGIGTIAAPLSNAALQGYDYLKNKE